MVRKPKRKRPAASGRRTQAIVITIISVLVVLSMALGLALSVSQRSAPSGPTATPLSLMRPVPVWLG